mmetsp:Transcript_41737/g.61097  ORF Transcript_41737/g.61097 Transcript_41737/m.61097 type:complete len:756 (-) Transcript_41737:567-2834(-)
MVKAIATPSNPVVLFLDDLHWADMYSLHLLTVLATDREIKHFLLIGCFRDDEMVISHPLAVALHEIQNRNVDLTKIKVANIETAEINALVSDAFHFPESTTAYLTDIIHQKTRGNILCITQFLQSLCDRGLLQWSSVSNSWEIKLRSIEADFVPDDPEKMFLRKILQLPVKTQLALKLMSCVGSTCSESTLLLFLEDEMMKNIEEEKEVERADKPRQRSEMLLYLNVALPEGLVKKEGLNYKFIHDQVQHAAYSLIPKDEKHLWHLRIGKNIWMNVPKNDENKVIFIAADQMNLGMSSIKSEDEKMMLAKLNLRAGMKAMSLSTFSSCASYFSDGIKLLRKDHWENDYELSLHLHNYYAEAEYCNGNFSQAREVIKAVFDKSIAFYDRLRAYFVLIKMLGAENKLREALEMGITVLTCLGKSLPFGLCDVSTASKDFNKIRATFESMTDDEFFGIRAMENSDALITMSFTSELLVIAYFINEDMCVCLVNYMLQLSLNYGVCKESSFALASFSGLLFGLGDLKASKKSSHFALSLLDRLNCKEMLPRVYICVYSSALIKHETSKKVSEKFLYGYEVGMQTGDILFAMYCARTYCTQRFFCGVGLDELVRDIEVWRQQMIAYKQMWNLNIFNSFRHKVLTLINYSDDNLQQFNDLFAEGMKSLKSHIEQKRHLPATVLCSYFSCTAYFFCEYDFARDMIETKWKLEKNIKRKYWAVGAAKFYETLICIALARETNEDKWRKYALQCFEEEKKTKFQ